MWFSINAGIDSIDSFNLARSPTPFKFCMANFNLATASCASEGTIAPERIRAASNATSDASISNFLTKYARASSALLPGYEPTAFSPVEVIT